MLDLARYSWKSIAAHLIFDTVRLYNWMYWTISSSNRSVMDSKSANVSFWGCTGLAERGFKKKTEEANMNKNQWSTTSVNVQRRNKNRQTSSLGTAWLPGSSQTSGSRYDTPAAPAPGRSSLVSGLHCCLRTHTHRIHVNITPELSSSTIFKSKFQLKNGLGYFF